MYIYREKGLETTRMTISGAGQVCWGWSTPWRTPQAFEIRKKALIRQDLQDTAKGKSRCRTVPIVPPLVLKHL